MTENIIAGDVLHIDYTGELEYLEQYPQVINLDGRVVSYGMSLAEVIHIQIGETTVEEIKETYNLQNEYITHKVAGKNDFWFHVKGMPGSHTVMLTNGDDPPAENFTEAAEIAAFYSKGAEGENVEVDYTLVRNVKKPAGGKPGLVIYHTNWSCVVTPNAERIKAMRVK